MGLSHTSLKYICTSVKGQYFCMVISVPCTKLENFNLLDPLVNLVYAI